MREINFKELGIESDIVKALNKLGYSNPMEVQKKVLPFILEERDLIVKSQTGSGKTGAFAIPLCQKVEIEKREPQVLILAPTRELALQIKEEIGHIGRFKKVRAAAVYGRHPIDLQKRELSQRVHMVVGTPGRTMDHIQRGNLDISDIKYLVIDEADEMLNMGFIDQVEDIINLLPKDRTTLLFSATMPERIEEVCQKYMDNSHRIEVESVVSNEDKIKQVYYDVEEEDKIERIYRIIEHDQPGSCILFCNTRDKVEILAREMGRKRYSIGALHGGMSQRERVQTMNGFKRGEIHYLIATDVAARGIHVEDITHVINYEVPYEKDNYVHRIGRTGRVRSKGIAINLVSSKEKHRFKEIESYLGYKIEQGKELSSSGPTSNSRTRERIKPKVSKAKEINKEITRIRINAGKKKKLRPGDIMGAISNIKGVNPENIGIIDIQDTCTYVEIFEGQGNEVIRGLEKTGIKGRKFSLKKVSNRE